MRTETITIKYLKFSELTEESKDKAVQTLWSINIDHEWWDGTFDDAKTVGCEITEFDTDRGNSIDFSCDNAVDTAELIMKHHGKSCDTFKLAKEFFYGEEKTEENCTEFVRALGEEFLIQLRREYEYLTSEESIIETIEANEYEFTEDGKIA